MDLTYAIVDVKGKGMLNHTKITKEDAFNIIKENSLQEIGEGSGTEYHNKCSLPTNFDVIRGILEYKGVYATPAPTFNHFKGKKFVEELPVFAIKNAKMGGVVQDVKKFLERGLEVYIHSYYIMEMDRYIDDELTVQEPWYWYRIGFAKK